MIVFLISNSLFPQRKKQKANMYNVLYLIATPLTKVFFLVSKIRRKAVGLPMERVNIESEGSEEAEEESRRFIGNVS